MTRISLPIDMPGARPLGDSNEYSSPVFSSTEDIEKRLADLRDQLHSVESLPQGEDGASYEAEEYQQMLENVASDTRVIQEIHSTLTTALTSVESIH